jgi:hypothetical protein
VVVVSCLEVVEKAVLEYDGWVREANAVRIGRFLHSMMSSLISRAIGIMLDSDGVRKRAKISRSVRLSNRKREPSERHLCRPSPT